jgi:hypothetical protein
MGRLSSSASLGRAIELLAIAPAGSIHPNDTSDKRFELPDDFRFFAECINRPMFAVVERNRERDKRLAHRHFAQRNFIATAVNAHAQR